MPDKRKKILYVITKSNFGGAQRYVFELATALPKDQYEVAVACGGDGILTEKLKAAGIPIFEIKSFQRDINFKKEFSSLFELARIIRTFRPDIVHLNSSKAGGIGALVSRLLGVRNIIFTAHGWAFWENRSVLWRLIVWKLSWITALLSHHIIVVSNYEFTHTPLPFVKKKLTCIHTAVPTIAFKERNRARVLLFPETDGAWHGDAVWVVSTSEHNRNKNLLTLIQAVEAFNVKNVQKVFLTLMSDGDERDALEAYVRGHKLTSSIAFTGYVEDARSYLKAFDIFALPSRKEGFPYGLLEAGAAGLACIASNVGGIPEIITNQETGILINPDETESIVRALEYIMNDTPRDLPTQYILGEALQKKVLSEYTLAYMCEQTQKLYR
jgi:glycosyltransferase involved in cell wall biosynthesis